MCKNNFIPGLRVTHKSSYFRVTFSCLLLSIPLRDSRNAYFLS